MDKVAGCISGGDIFIGDGFYLWVHEGGPIILGAKNKVSMHGNDLTDYKFMCFNGKVRCTFTCTDRRSSDGLKVTFFDNDWKQLPFERHYPAAKAGSISKPVNFELMKTLAEKLAEDIPFVRVDFYEINNRVYFGELTFYPGAGMEEFNPLAVDYELGAWIDLNVQVKK